MNDKIISLGFLDGLLEAIMRRFKKIDNALPQEEPAPYQQLVTGADGTVKWEERMAYAKESVVVDILPETTVEFAPIPNYPEGWLGTQPIEILDKVSACNTCRVRYDGTEYMLTAYQKQGGVWLGNQYMTIGWTDTGEPFGVMFNFESMQCAFVASGTSTETHTISIERIDTDVEVISGEHLYDLVLGANSQQLHHIQDLSDFYIESGSITKTLDKLQSGKPVKVSIHISLDYGDMFEHYWYDAVNIHKRPDYEMMCSFWISESSQTYSVELCLNADGIMFANRYVCNMTHDISL